MHKLKMNKRLFQIGIFSLIAAIILVFLLYSTFKKSVQPEPTEKIAYFLYNIDRDKVIEDPGSNMVLKSTPVSLIPEGAIKDLSLVKDKRLINYAQAGDFVLADDFASRGEVRVDIENMYQLSVKVDQISNFLGTQIKDGEFYGLMYINGNGDSENIYKVKIVNLVDSTGKIIIESGSSTADALNIAVETTEDIRAIAERKRKGTFELIKPPDEFWNSYKVEVSRIDENPISSDGESN